MATVTVRCPECGRALALPESSDSREAMCPLCRAVFEVPANAPVPTVSPSAARLPPTIDLEPKRFDDPPKRGDPDLPVPPSGRFDPLHPPDPPPDPEREADRKALDSARNWLAVAGIVGLIHSFSCGCCFNTSVLGDRLLARGEFFLLVLLLRPAAFWLIWAGGRAMERRRNPALARAAGWVAAAEATFQGLTFLMVLATSPSRRAVTDSSELWFVLNLSGALDVGVLALTVVSAFKTLTAMDRPGVRAMFRG